MVTELVQTKLFSIHSTNIGFRNFLNPISSCPFFFMDIICVLLVTLNGIHRSAPYEAVVGKVLYSYILKNAISFKLPSKPVSVF